jgi:type II secretory pathway pseudopilin PulG
MNHNPRQQRGMTLMVALIMLVLLTLFAVTGFNLGKSSLQIVGNMQQRSQAAAAAQSAMEEVISGLRFFQTPGIVFFLPCAGPNTRCIDINGDGVPDVTVTFTPNPVCVTGKTIKNSSLDLTKPNDAGCALGVAQNFGVVGSVTGDSLCADSVWQINAVAVDNVTQAQTALTQGVSVRVSTDDISTSCP